MHAAQFTHGVHQTIDIGHAVQSVPANTSPSEA